jgi:hypothetical protein
MRHLETLRAYLHHFDQSPDFGDGEAVSAIRILLMTRIREVENSVRCLDRVQPPAEAKGANGCVGLLESDVEAA